MDPILKYIEVRWADLDPNFHVRHSVYYDYGATSRIDFLQQQGLTAQFMQQYAFGPIIFREECVFKKEIRLNDVVSIDIRLTKATPDLAKWTIKHNIYKAGNILSAILTIDGAWIDVVKRKLTLPPKEAIQAFHNMPRHEAFEWIVK